MFLLFVSFVACSLHPPQLHVALLAHVASLGVLIQRVFGDLCAHLQQMQLVSAMGEVAAKARHLSTRERIESYAYRMPGIRMSEAVIGG